MTSALDQLMLGLGVRNYAARPGVRDEMMSMPGQVPTHWRELLDRLNELGAPELQRRRDQLRRTVSQGAITYPNAGDPRGMDRPWLLDPLPHVLPNHEWKALEEGLVQRATALNEIIKDLYGPQHLLRTGLLKSETVFAHPNFLRPCHGLRVPGEVFLHLYAADVVRANDGRWVVLRDHTRAPAGMGYALENRITMLRAFPEVYHDPRVKRLLPFFNAYRDQLRALAPRHRDNPRIVLLSPGSAEDTYFEHIYLSRYLGFPLVEGSDLTVRDDQVFLKTLGGLIPVDVILRRVDDAQCDPVELDGTSMNGVPGLKQAVQSGNVAVANALGSGLLNTAVFSPFVNDMARMMVGRDLILRGPRSWWCGDGRSADLVLGNLNNLVIKRAFDSVRLGRAARELSVGEREDLAKRIKARPADYVAQEVIDFSTSPAWTDNGLEPRPVVFRFYVAATPNGYVAMPGGLTRIGSSENSLLVAMQDGAHSKDTLILGDEQEGPSVQTMLQHVSSAMPLARSGMDMPSRVADDLFWLGRYVERVEGVVRLLRAIIARMTTENRATELSELPALVSLLEEMGLADEGAIERLEKHAGHQFDNELLDILFAIGRPGNLRDLLTHLHRTAWSVRARMSLDAWSVLTRLDRDLCLMASREVSLGDAAALLDELIVPLAAYSGLVMESMTRGPAWRFLDMGRRLERAQHMNALIRTITGEPRSNNAPLLQAILETADSAMTYRSRYLSSYQVEAVVDLLLADDSNPRSTAFQLERLAEHIESLPHDPSAPLRDPEQRLTLSAVTRTRVASVATLCAADSEGRMPQLTELLDKLDGELRELSDIISHRYFSHSAPPRQLADPASRPQASE